MNIADKTYDPTPARRIACIGLGTMGAPMAVHLQRAGHHVTVYNRTAAKATQWVQTHGGQCASTPREAAQSADIAITCVGNDDDLREVCTGPQGAFHSLAPGAVIVDHTTTSAEVARELAQAAREQGLHFIDAPVSGGNLGALNGVLTIMCGGDADAFARIEPVIAAYARAVTHLGDSGAGQLMAARSSALTSARANSPVMPWPTSAGVLGMARTMRGVPSRRAMSSVRRPAITL